MKTIAVIPARGGSKGLPDKNKRLLGGIPLVARTIRAARQSDCIDAVYVSSDDNDILRIAVDWGAVPIRRPDSIATDSATSESALFHVLDKLKEDGLSPETLVFLQCTSPFTTSTDIDAVVSSFEASGADCAFSVTDSHGFLWAIDEDGFGRGVNHDHNQQRKRRQDLPPEYLETGAVYTMNIASFRKAGHRFCGKLLPVPVKAPAIEIDSVQDWLVAESLSRVADRPLREVSLLRRIRVIVTDFDGVHTDDRVIVNELGQEAVICSRRDGMGIEKLRGAGYRILVLSKEQNVVVKRRAEKLKLEVIHGADQKADVLENWLEENDLEWSDIAFVGNDINDVECIRKAALGLCPSDAAPSVLRIADVVLPAEGGKGALRQLAEIALDDFS
ncbi:acylneuraminate cytidylyltransferase [Coralliovum pocilloporae]|uniref:acylneuraminate cytidylyltransferase n=1 Tax=Coralliovum pocilloporae TaxID=3066369 RepID=UPI00330754E0